MLPRWVQRLGEESNDVYFREDAKVILKKTLAMEEAEAATQAAAEEAQAAAEAAAGVSEESSEEEMVEIDASGNTSEEDVFEEE